MAWPWTTLFTLGTDETRWRDLQRPMGPNDDYAVYTRDRWDEVKRLTPSDRPEWRLRCLHSGPMRRGEETYAVWSARRTTTLSTLGTYETKWRDLRCLIGLLLYVTQVCHSLPVSNTHIPHKIIIIINQCITSSSCPMLLWNAGYDLQFKNS